MKTVLAGDFVGSKYNANFRVGYKTGTNPFVLAPFGPDVTAQTKAKIDDARSSWPRPTGPRSSGRSRTRPER